MFNNKDDKLNKNIYPEEGHKKPVLIWSNSQFNKKTYENLFYKKTFDKYVPVREKLVNENKNSNSNGILPELQTLQNYTNFDNNIKSSIYVKNNLRSKSIDKTNQIINKNSNVNNNINSTNDTSAFTHSSKKYFSPRALYTQNYTEDLSKFRMGLLSAGSSCNNNIIIPLMSFRMPVSNFKLNAERDINNENIEVKNKEINIDSSNSKITNNIYNKTNSASRNNKPFRHAEMKKRLELFQSKNDINNLYIGMDKMITKLHKIKIEKGMMNSGIVNSLNKKFNRDYQCQIEQFKKGHLPMVFDNQNNNIGNNIDKNKIRSHSFNNKNNFY